MSMVKKKEKREAVLYAHIRPSIKKWLKKDYKTMGYSTLSEYVDVLLQKLKEENERK